MPLMFLRVFKSIVYYQFNYLFKFHTLSKLKVHVYLESLNHCFFYHANEHAARPRGLTTQAACMSDQV